MNVRAKICGLSTPETVDAAVEAGADFVGFVTFPRSPRHIESLDLLKALGARVPSRVIRVGLFVDADDALIDARLATGAIDMLQLHGAETAERVAALKASTGKPVIKAIKVADPADVERGIAAYAGVADRLMFDAADGTLPGGNAKAFDWTFLSGRTVPVPWFLAGGLNPGNVAEAVRVTGARAVDVSSGVEAARGVKSTELIRAFLGAVRVL
ncbi:phosphoribosylanthranilate isomerase [Reyranella sp.]|jgi:phosphoribosylanthranilate isomerase|uniref:phosphoribosylanthranilate isomerase n=1 Tax=Reyranella sp. TaxID=1929291 RepID=UPI000BDD1E3E|nr:phosphoribosylanthranilate isomerase [Reyranella sp.]OYY34930.1 MAG: N-(5'-phosphoribosyl)anthranilate isomerase [Rhodospirillales bacterium 35-66-84]OYZ91354.1 MAG: N-(5'-phosphoribosyl)anthranilate isomerase [Rhodospirillales bacterium 24-66-33]OZB21413.1 MAG: N-(5'-phosphoribosyl)anthranilate isomerase [Rhodospirillales bacterium 39-66-50]HQS18218.1 phosphoribosylanthranilate isomerase [Reyranella sp.]HQT14716.1 phosphoribosylanthranilate isomerase [Reyranella sp.]